MSVGENRARRGVRSVLQRLAQPAKQGLNLLFVQHGRFHQQCARSGRDQAQVVLDRQLDRVFNKPRDDGLIDRAARKFRI